MAQHIKTFLYTLVSSENSWKHQLLQNWHTIFGNLSTKITLEKVYDNILVLGVLDSCWMQELYLLSPLLLNKINENLDQPYVKQVRFKQAGIKRDKKQLTTQKKIIHKKQFYLSPIEERALKKINDPQLRNVLKAFRMRCQQESK
ncbi:MAG: DciA family protein [Candidatus Babeliales bacterium]